jgi:hypothetical protein
MNPPATQPPTADSGGRNPDGTFARGNRLSQGNAAARKAATFRARLFGAVSAGDFTTIVKRIVQEAKGGEAWACKLLLSYLLGEPQPFDFLARLESLEQNLLEHRK